MIGGSPQNWMLFAGASLSSGKPETGVPNETAVRLPLFGGRPFGGVCEISRHVDYLHAFAATIPETSSSIPVPPAEIANTVIDQLILQNPLLRNSCGGNR